MEPSEECAKPLPGCSSPHDILGLAQLCVLLKGMHSSGSQQLAMASSYKQARGLSIPPKHPTP